MNWASTAGGSGTMKTWMPVRCEHEGWPMRCNERAAENDESVIALVSHGTFIDQLLKALMNQSENGHQFFYSQNNTSITLVDFLGDGPMVLRYSNRTQHLPADLITR